MVFSPRFTRLARVADRSLADGSRSCHGLFYSDFFSSSAASDNYAVLLSPLLLSWRSQLYTFIASSQHESFKEHV